MEACVCSICGTKLSNVFAHRAHHFIEHATATEQHPSPSDIIIEYVKKKNELKILTFDENSNQLSAPLEKDAKNSMDEVERLTRQIKQFTLEQKSCELKTVDPDTRTGPRSYSSIKIFHCGVFRKHMTAQTMQEHKLKQKDGKFICDSCGMKFESYRDLTYHHFLKHRRNQIRCHICGLSQPSAEAFAVHLKLIHPRVLDLD